MNIIEICVPFSVAILGLAYPIILQVIARLDEKYGSDFVALFKEENEYQWFVLLLKSNLITLLIYIGGIQIYIPLFNPTFGILLVWLITLTIPVQTAPPIPEHSAPVFRSIQRHLQSGENWD